MAKFNTYIKGAEDLPESGALFIVISSSTIYIPGDERSQTNPGHGYPAENKPIPVIHAFEDEASLQGWLAEQREGFQFKLIKGNIIPTRKKVAYELDMAQPTRPQGANTGHGHVYPRPDGVKCRCGGPSFCAECKADLVQKEGSR